MLGRALGVTWGVLGVVAVLIYAVLKLSRFVVEAVESGLTGPEWLVLLVSVALTGYAEGVRGFQHRFSPRVAARALYLYRNPTGLRLVLAPWFCAGFFAGTLRLVGVTWIGTALIVVLIALVDLLAQPWRGIVDAGVLAGLGWGCVTLLWLTLRTFRAGRPLADPEVPGGAGL